MSTKAKRALDVLVALARQQYGDSDATPASAYRFSLSPDGERLEILKSPMNWRTINLRDGNA